MGITSNGGILFAVVLFVTILLTGPQVQREDRETTWGLVLSWYALLCVAVYEIVRISALSLQQQGPVVHIGFGLSAALWPGRWGRQPQPWRPPTAGWPSAPTRG